MIDARLLTAAVPAGLLNVRAIDRSGNLSPKVVEQFFPAGAIDELQRFADEYGNRDIYFGVVSRAARDGSLKGCGYAYAVFVDIDFKDTDEETARDRLAAFPLPPSVIVKSGGGLHVYWLLSSPHDVRNGGAARFKDVLRRTCRAVGGDIACADTAHILRIPGTSNHKYGAPRPVTVEVFDDTQRYTIDDFEFLPEDPTVRPIERRAPQPPSFANLSDDDIIQRARRAKNGAQFISLFDRGEISPNYDSHSEADMALCCHLAFWTNKDESQIDRLFRRSALYREDKWDKRSDYRACTISAAISRTTETYSMRNHSAPQRTAPAVTHESRAPEPDSAEAQVSFIDWGSKFLAIEDPPLEYLTPELTPRGVLQLNHGHPRSMKSLSAAEEFVALATGTPAFGLERFRPQRAYRVLFCSQEDTAPIVRPRIKAMLRGRGIDGIPDTMAFAVYKGIDFDIPEWQARFHDQIIAERFDFVVIDPMRYFTAHADKGPSDVMPVAKVLRPVAAAGVTLRLVHHDTKPPATGPDARSRSHRASGGGWFSVCECPISFEKISDSSALVIPEDYKLSASPQPFTIHYTDEKDAKGKTVSIKLIGEDSTAEDASTLAIDSAVVAYLCTQPGASTNTIQKAVKKGQEAVTQSLHRLLEAGKVDCLEGARRAKLWTLRERLP